MVFLRRPAAHPLSGASVAKRSRLLAAAAAVLFAAAIVIAVTGAFRRSFGPFVVAVRRPGTLAFAAWLLAVLSTLDDGSPIRGVWRRAGRLACPRSRIPRNRSDGACGQVGESAEIAQPGRQFFQGLKHSSIAKHFEAAGVASTEENRRRSPAVSEAARAPRPGMAS